MIAVFALIGCNPFAPAADEHEHEHDHGAVHDDEHAEPGELVIDQDARRDLRVTTATARSGTGDERAAILGELTVDEGRYAEVGSPVAGRIRALLADAGQTVRAGAPLVEIDAAELGRARAEVVAASARARSARAAVERKRLLRADTVSAVELADAEAQAEQADAQLDAAEAALTAFGAGSATTGGATFTLRAPLDGVVLTREARRGELIDPTHTLFRVADTSELWMVAHAFERDALRITKDSPAEVRFAALPDRAFDARVALVGAEVDPGSRTVPVRLAVDNAEGLLRPGMSGTARLPLASDAGVVAVPSAALQRLDEGWVVFVPIEPGRFSIRPVGRGRDLGDQVEVLSGLSHGETVVVDGSFLLKAEADKRAGGGDAHGH